jgi:hypothetical protein
MDSTQDYIKTKIFRHFSIPPGILLLVLAMAMTACAGNYGQLKQNAEVQQEFEANQVPRDYKYFHYSDSEPYVILGLEPSYIMESTMWRDVSSDTEAFQEMVRWIWEDYGYHKFGADILDPTGKKVGIIYTAIRETSVKFVGDNKIVVIPNKPFLWGPDTGGGGGVRAP